jgi:peptide/nickel transport system substrate-binding protein
LGVVTALSVTAISGPESGVLRIQHMDTPPSASIHEEATVSTAVPFMSVFNKLVMFDQKWPNSFESIVPDLATSWSERRRQAHFKLREGVKWHGKSHSPEDVVCTVDLLLGKGACGAIRAAPGARMSKATRLRRHAAFKHRQPRCSLLASGCSPIYPATSRPPTCGAGRSAPVPSSSSS